MGNIPDLSKSFPSLDPSIKIKSDLNNDAHGPHFDVFRAIPGGTDQVRVSPDGNIVSGTTNIGKGKVSW